MGLIKTDPEFLKNVLKEINLNKEDCLVIGDSMQSDIIASEKAGIKAILVDRRNSRDFQTKIKNLKELREILNN